MGIYRLETAPTARAICRSTECKKDKVKIPKGSIRFGAWVDFREYQAWVWRHWGCVTPQMIANLNETIEGDLEMLDGYDELDEDSQEKVRKALADGHIADEEWNGDIEQNRPGMKGLRSPATKKRAKDEAKARAADENGEESPAKPTRKKRGPKNGDADEEGAGTDTVQKKPRAATKKRTRAKEEDVEEEIEEEQVGAEDAKATSNKGRVMSKKRARIAEADSQNGESAMLEKKPRAATKGRPPAIKTEGSDDSEPQTILKKSKAPVKKASRKAAVTSGGGDDLEHGSSRKARKPKRVDPANKLESSPEAPPPKGTRSRRTALKLEGEPVVLKQEESAANDDEEIVKEQFVQKEAPKKRGRRKAATKSTTS